MWEQNSGQCGLCGDAYHLDSPRPHEAGGMYAKGIISKFYAAGQVRNSHIFFESFSCSNPQIEMLFHHLDN